MGDDRGMAGEALVRVSESKYAGRSEPVAALKAGVRSGKVRAVVAMRAASGSFDFVRRKCATDSAQDDGFRWLMTGFVG